MTVDVKRVVLNSNEGSGIVAKKLVNLKKSYIKGFHTVDFILNDHNYITLLYMHINFFFQFQCEIVVFTTLNLLAKNLTK